MKREVVLSWSCSTLPKVRIKVSVLIFLFCNNTKDSHIIRHNYRLCNKGHNGKIYSLFLLCFDRRRASRTKHKQGTQKILIMIQNNSKINGNHEGPGLMYTGGVQEWVLGQIFRVIIENVINTGQLISTYIMSGEFLLPAALVGFYNYCASSVLRVASIVSRWTLENTHKPFVSGLNVL